MSEWTARNFMNVADLFGKSGTVPDFSGKVLYALSAPSTPEPIREEIMRRAEAGEKVKAGTGQWLGREYVPGPYVT